MEFEPTPVAGAFLIRPTPSCDTRGSFSRLYCRREMLAAGLEGEFVQDSESRNSQSGTLRGLHYNAPPYEEVKLVRCTSGAIFDVLVDLRHDSPTYLTSFTTELTAANSISLYIPKGVAHGFQTLSDNATIHYKISQFYHPGRGRGVRWNDPLFAINWPDVTMRIMSDRDRSYPDYQPARVPGA